MPPSKPSAVAAFAKLKDTAQRGGHWFKKRLNGCHSSQASADTRSLSIGPPTNFRHEDLTLGMDNTGNKLLVQRAREDAWNMHKDSKTEKVKRHARSFSARVGFAAEGKHSEGHMY